MKDLASHLLDILQNALRANATRIAITIQDEVQPNVWQCTIADNGCGMTEAEMREEEKFWNEYVQHHIPEAYPGIREIVEEQKRRGGRVCVVSHSFSGNIRRDYRENGLAEPDLIFGWECPPEEQKPSVRSLQKQVLLMPINSFR